MRVIIPRECSSGLTEHCIGSLGMAGAIRDLVRAIRCDYCGRFMPLDEAIDFPEGDAS